MLLLWNHLDNWNQTAQEWSLEGPLFFLPIGNPRWLPPQVIVLKQDHMGKYRNIFFSEIIALIEPKLCINHWKVLFKLCDFYVDWNSKMTATAGHSFYVEPIGSFYNQVNDTGSWEPLFFFIINVYNTCVILLLIELNIINKYHLTSPCYFSRSAYLRNRRPTLNKFTHYNFT